MKGYLTSNLNQLTFDGDFDDESLRRTLAALHNLQKQGYSSVDLSLRNLTKAMTPQMLPLSINCRRLLHEGFETRLELPSDTKLQRLFLNTNWAYLIDPLSHGITGYNSEQHLPAQLYTTPEEQYLVVDRAVELLLRSLKLVDRKQVEAVEWSLNEIADNVLNHANSPVGGAVQVTVRSARNVIEFVVADAGLGIPQTLRASHKNLTSDVEALDAAIREGVTRNTSTNMGNGLFGTFRLAQLSKGKFGLFSGRASLSFQNDFHSKPEQIPFRGTAVVCTIDISKPDLLSEALKFRGREGPLGYTIVDKFNDDDVYHLRLAQEATSFGSRIAARPVRTKIENVIRTSSTNVKIDLDEVALITSSFADEVIGKLFADLGPLTFMNRITIVGGSKIVRQLVDRAIAQRMSLAGSGSQSN